MQKQFIYLFIISLFPILLNASNLNKINEIDPTWKKYKCFKCHGVSGEISLEGKRPLSNRKYKSVKNAFVLMKFKKKFKYSEDNIKEHEPIYNNKITNEDLEKLSYYLGRYQ